MIKNENGSSIILISAALVVLISMAALVIDLGMVFVTKNKLQNTADAAALAAAQEMPWSTEHGKQAVKDIAEDFIKHNGFDTEDAHIVLEPDGATVVVYINHTLSHTFAKIMGFTHQTTGAKASAVNAPISAIKGVKPLAVVEFPFVYGEQYTLKVGSGDGTSGNYGALALGGTGSSNYENNLVKGFNEFISVNDIIKTETGNMSGPTNKGIETLLNQCKHTPTCTYNDYHANCPRIMIIPIIDSLNISGRDGVKVVGFASFFLEGTNNSGGHTQVIGRFISTFAPGEIQIGQYDYGVRNVKLVQ